MLALVVCDELTDIPVSCCGNRRLELCTLQRACSGRGGKCNPPSYCRGLGKLSHGDRCLLLCLSACTLVNEGDAVVDDLMSVIVRVETAVRRRAVSDYCSTGFDPRTNNSHRCVSGSVRKGSEKRFSGFSLDTTKDPLPVSRVTSVAFKTSVRSRLTLPELETACHKV
jgi:hypothetical protein